ncbi:MAG: prepilin-type N-terminal cleavage/methylation domain-containing protein [Gammaproteobacteria bacterium]|nr:prepilin-type N-terminal cleavage/methylation domain-containing protein [Gammaproteobacteria bacterium]
MKNQKGFTLVEMAIVLVIIGLLLGGVLKGQELIENSRIKNAMNDIRGTQAALNAYMDRYHQIPGDDNDPNLTNRGGAWTGLTLGDGNGALSRNNPFAGDANETVFFWQHLRAGGFVSGSPKTTGLAALPKNAYGGLIGVTGIGVFGMPANGKYVCLSGITGKAARAIDLAMDDGLAKSGTMRAAALASTNTGPGTAAPTDEYTDEPMFTICTTM